MPKFTIQQIKNEMVALEQGGFKAAVHYLNHELKRRKGSARNAGKPVQYDTPRHIANREAARRYRRNKQGRLVEDINLVVVDET